MTDRGNDIVLVFGPPRKTYHPPVDIAYLAVNIKLKGFTVEIRDLNHQLFRAASRDQKRLWQKTNEDLWENPEKVDWLFEIMHVKIAQLVTDLLKAKATVIYFDIEYPNASFSSRLIRSLKTRDPRLTILAGGTGCCRDAQRADLIAQSRNTIDYFVVGDAEQTVAEILKACRDEKAPLQFPGVVAAKSSPVKVNPAQPLDLEKIACPTYEEFDISAYKRRSLAVKWSRGCIENCLFCIRPVSERGYRVRSATRIIDELHYHITKYGIRNFVVTDPAVNGRPEHLENICDAIIKASLNISWSAKAVPLPSLTRGLLAKMLAAGCHTLIFCTVSGSNDILSTMGRSIKTKTAEEVMRRAHASGIKVAVNLIVGFPGEYRRQFEETLEFLRRNPHPFIQHLYDTSTLRVHKGTLLHQQADRFGLILPENESPNRWYTRDGNTNDIRKQRQQDVLNQALRLRIETGHTFLQAPGKEYSLLNKLSPKYKWKRFLYHCYKGHESSDTVNDGLHSKIIERVLSRLTPVCKAEEKDLPVLESIREGLRACIGPEVVHLDLTSRCNMDCIACWNESPLVTGGLKRDDTHANVLSYQTVTHLIDDLIQLRGMRRLKLSGGEPTMHPKFKEILAYLRKKDKYTEIEINTNFSLVDEKLIKLITDLEVDVLTVSLWAGTAAVYKRTHPNQSEKTFKRIVENLNLLVKTRKAILPKIAIHNVLMKLNYHDVDAMMELSLDIGADEIHFVLIDPVPGKTDQLLLDQEQRKALAESLKRIHHQLDRFGIYAEPSSGRSIRVANIDELIGKLSQSTTEEGIYDQKTLEKIPCYIGWIYTRVMADGKIAPCCKGHRLPMGNLYKQRFKEIWESPRYTRFRHNGLTMKKSAPYFSAIGNHVTRQTGCYNCDNIMHNLVMHEKFLSYSHYSRWVKFQLSKWINRKIEYF